MCRQVGMPAVLGFSDGAAGLPHCVISLCYFIGWLLLVPVSGFFSLVSLVA